MEMFFIKRNIQNGLFQNNKEIRTLFILPEKHCLMNGKKAFFISKTKRFHQRFHQTMEMFVDTVSSDIYEVSSEIMHKTDSYKTATKKEHFLYFRKNKPLFFIKTPLLSTFMDFPRGYSARNASNELKKKGNKKRTLFVFPNKNIALMNRLDETKSISENIKQLIIK